MPVRSAKYLAQLERNRIWKAENRKTVRGYLQQLRYNTQLNAKTRGLECDIELPQLLSLYQEQEGRCALTGDEMTWVTGRGQKARTHTNISIDRIDPSRGYHPDNIQLVCAYANRVKTDLSMAELLDTCKKILREAGEL